MTAASAPRSSPSFAGAPFSVLAGLDIRVPYVSESIAVTRWHCREPAHITSREKRQPWHVLGFVHGGSFRIRSRRGATVVDPAAILLLRPDEDYQTAHVSCCGDHGSAIAMRPEVAREFQEESERRGGADPWSRQTRPADAGLLARQLDLLHRLSSGTGSPTLARLGIDEALLDLGARVLLPACRRQETAKPMVERIAAVQEFLERRFTEPLRLDEIAHAVELSPFHLCRQFRRHTGWTIHRYLTHLRVVHGLERLSREPATRLLDLALDLGFDGHSHFSAVFRRLVGRTPSAFRAAATC